MAGDWIKMRADLHTHPKVVRIASALKADRLRVVGGLHAVWCLFDVHSEDGVLDGYTPDALDDMIGFPGFARSLVSVGWLIEEPDSLVVPRFDEHNGQSAKRRAQETQRKREARKTSASDADNLRSREEKRREELKTEGSKSACSETRENESSNASARAVDLSIVLRESGIDSNPADPRLQALADQGVSIETARAAAKKARQTKPNERISTGYVAAIITGWAADAAKVQAAGAIAPSGKPAKFDPVAFVNRNRPTESHERTPDCIDVEAKHVA
ncbi:hypothetical protein [Caballeronia sp. GAWG1-5s-s]|uniref:hypothetical protein n=1 Tax=Caballeronia sp. GAWG1-5s-s TaxID=2921743 RepID=UPI002029785B|nr:hypothetical protein [Caballeronia sp. GAWG1-5s-s]